MAEPLDRPDRGAVASSSEDGGGELTEQMDRLCFLHRGLPAAIFSGMAEGRYELRVSGGGPGSSSLFVDGADATVTVADWPGPEV
jgi:hypothetical protein